VPFCVEKSRDEGGAEERETMDEKVEREEGEGKEEGNGMERERERKGREQERRGKEREGKWNKREERKGRGNGRLSCHFAQLTMASCGERERREGRLGRKEGMTIVDFASQSFLPFVSNGEIECTMHIFQLQLHQHCHVPRPRTLGH
jgi:hypothetical protein